MAISFIRVDDRMIHETALSAVNDITTSPFSALLIKIYPASFRQISYRRHISPESFRFRPPLR